MRDIVGCLAAIATGIVVFVGIIGINFITFNSNGFISKWIASACTVSAAIYVFKKITLAKKIDEETKEKIEEEVTIDRSETENAPGSDVLSLELQTESDNQLQTEAIRENITNEIQEHLEDNNIIIEKNNKAMKVPPKGILNRFTEITWGNIGCFGIPAIILVMIIVFMMNYSYKDEKNDSKIDDYKAKQETVDLFFEDYNESSPTPFLSKPDIINFEQGELDLCTRLNKGNYYIVDLSLLSLYNKETEILSNKSENYRVSIKIGHGEKIIEAKDVSYYALCSVGNVSESEQAISCQVEFRGIMLFTDKTILKNPEKVKEKIAEYGEVKEE